MPRSRAGTAHGAYSSSCADTRSLVCACVCGHCSWQYVNYAYGTQSREFAEALYRDDKFHPVNGYQKDSRDACIRTLLRWNMIAYQRGRTAADDVIQLLDPALHVPKGGQPRDEQQVQDAFAPNPPKEADPPSSANARSNSRSTRSSTR
jgi:hypothetical protein